MTVLASVAAGGGGKVLSFEPHPDLFALLDRNVSVTRKTSAVAKVELHQAALGEQLGTADLQVPTNFEANDGIARITSTPTPGERTLKVQVSTLDDVLGETCVDVLKLDVEGYEPQVLKGALRTLADRRIKHIVFEDFSIVESEAARILISAGYQLFSLGWSMRGICVQPAVEGNLTKKYEAENFIASLEASEVMNRCHTRGFLTLKRQTVNII